MERLRIIFMGSAQLSCPSLQSLLDAAWCQLIAVVTQPDRPKGRDLKLQPTPVKGLAQKRGLPVLQPEKARSPEFVAEIRAQRPDLIAVAAYGQILPRELLDTPRFGCLNVHTSLLPKYRGAAPIQYAILNDDPETGVTIMKVDVGLDTGDILTQERTPITLQDNAQTLHDRLADMGAALLVRTIPPYASGVLHGVPQPSEGVIYAPKIKKQDGLVDWSQPARQIWNRVRALVPWPCAFTYGPAATRPQLLKLWRAETLELTSGKPGEILHSPKGEIVVGTGCGALRIMELQAEGGRRLTAREFLAGHPLEAGTRFGAGPSN